MSETVKIYTAADMRRFRDRVNHGENKLDAVLMKDIDIRETDEKGCPVSWVPIGIGVKTISGRAMYREIYCDSSYEYYDPTMDEEIPIPYAGIFDGKGHTISGLWIDRKNDDTNSWGVAGLFGYNKGTIKNLAVGGFVKNRAASSTAGIAAVNEITGRIENCVNKCKVEGLSDIGGTAGIAGKNSSNGIINNCVNLGKIIGQGPLVSGIVGNPVIHSTRFNKFTITNCINKGVILVRGGVHYFGELKANNYKLNQVCCTDGFYRSNNNKQEGKVIFPFQNSLIGMFLRFYDTFNPYYNVAGLEIPTAVKALIMHDKNTEYVNELGQTYLHLICLGLLDRKGSIQEYIGLTVDIITILASETKIDFATKDNRGKTAADYVKNIPKVKDLIEEIAHEQAALRHEDNDDSFSTIGF